MPEYDNTNRGALFKNDQKDPNDDRDRDYNGTLNVDGTEYWISAWIKTSQKGMKFMSLSVKPKENQDHSGAAKAAGHKPARPEMDDDIPF